MKKLFNIFLIVSFILIQFSLVNAQNLVPNPSFEDTISCPTGIGNFSVAGWYSPTVANPDYFHSCNLGNVGVPQNGFGWQNPKTGNAYTGGHTSDFSSTDYREYIQCQLDSVLQAGVSYEISFYVSRSDSSTKACDNIGAYLSSTAISSSNNQNLPVVPQVTSPLNDPIIDPIGWTQVIDTISAIGGEKYLTIGIFSDNTNTNWVSVSGGWESEAHYYYDDVSVKRVNINSITEISQPIIRIFPNPVSDELLTVISNDLIDSIWIYSLDGKILFNDHPNSSNILIDFSTYPTGIYFLKAITKNKIQNIKIINP